MDLLHRSQQLQHVYIRLLSRELKEIVKQHRALRCLAGLSFLAPEASVAGDATNVDLPQITWVEARKILLTGATPAQLEKPKILSIEFSTQAEQARAEEKQQSQPEEQVQEEEHRLRDMSKSFSSSRFTGNQLQKQNKQTSDRLQLVPPTQVQVVVLLDIFPSTMRIARTVRTFMKHCFGIYKRAFYEKMDAVAANITSSQTTLETSLVHQFTEHLLQIAIDLDLSSCR
ncbi:hypothetical protein F511_31485 [Dorcoceras hygrometricum]|uniref:Uncharacterized protein n=1 Tax=Dorcoceras hygrometricum TaxID=472368 RepID=A0A2Z7D6I5_9LAMI|nr:hypothetical protein F511_31485 [Dorcoceras hygrometricum]